MDGIQDFKSLTLNSGSTELSVFSLSNVLMFILHNLTPRFMSEIMPTIFGAWFNSVVCHATSICTLFQAGTVR